jgi:hypothetical protein
MVLRAGIEPARPEGHRILSPVRLPIPPPKPANLEISITENQTQNSGSSKFFSLDKI